MPRDRNGEYEPIIIPNGTKDISELEEKIINMYSIGMTTRDISNQIEEMYGFEVSAEMVSRITNKFITDNKRLAKQTVRFDVCDNIYGRDIL